MTIISTIWIPLYSTCSLSTNADQRLNICNVEWQNITVTQSISSSNCLVSTATASMAVTNSYGFGIPIIQAGTLNGTGSLVTFNKAMPSGIYSVIMDTISGSAGLTGSILISNPTQTGFTASFNSFTGSVFWIVIGSI